MKIAKKALQALIETCAGNYSNQESAFKGQVVDAINQILRYEGSGGEEEVKVIRCDLRFVCSIKASYTNCI